MCCKNLPDKVHARFADTLHKPSMAHQNFAESALALVGPITSATAHYELIEFLMTCLPTQYIHSTVLS